MPRTRRNSARAIEAADALEAMASGKALSLDAVADLYRRGADLTAGGSGMGGPSDPLSQVTWVYTCVSAIGTACSGVPLMCSRGEASGTRALWGRKYLRAGREAGRTVRSQKGAEHRAAEGDIVASGPLVEFLARPNPMQTWPQLMAQTIGLLYAHGRVHWLFDEMVGRRPVNMYAVSGKATKPLYEPGGRVRVLAGWELRLDRGRRDVMLLDESLTFQLFNPHSAVEGMSPREPANLAIVSYYNAAKYNAAMFGNSGEPGGALTMDGEPTPEQREEIVTSWSQRHQGAGNAKRVALLWGGLKWQSIATTMQDLQFVEGARLTRTDICAAFRVPPSVAGWVEASGASSAYTDNELERFWQDTVSPLLDQIAAGINGDITPRFPGGLNAWFDLENVPVYARMRRSALTSAREAWSMGVPLADASDLYDLGLPDQPQHRVGFLPAGLLPAADVMMGSPIPSIPEGPAADDEPIEDEPENEPEGRSAKTPAPVRISKAAAEQIWRRWERSWSPLARAMRNSIRARVTRQQSRLRQALNALPDAPKAAGAKADPGQIQRILADVFQDTSDRMQWRLRLQSFAKDAAELGLRQTLVEAGLTGEQLERALEQLLADPRIIRQIQRESIIITSRTDDRTREILRRHLTEGLRRGETTRDLADRVQEVMQSSRSRALTISRHSTAQTLSAARHEALPRSGATHEIWLHSRGPGERRPAHIEAERRYAANPKPLHELWRVGSARLRFPRDPQGPPGETINCQCLTIARRLGAERSIESIRFVSCAEMLEARAAREAREAKGDNNGNGDAS